jgi:hypothetical protein
VSGPLYDEADVKRPKSFYDNRKPIPQDVLDYEARMSGIATIDQKLSSERCLHILDLKDLLPEQRKSYKENFMQAAREADPNLAKHIHIQNDKD